MTEVERLRARVAELEALINTPIVDDFLKGVPAEAAHQVERWGIDHDAGKSPWDWFWLVGYLAQKAGVAAVAAQGRCPVCKQKVEGDALTKLRDKAKHHTISTAAALFNWYAQLSGERTRMRPGIEGPE